MKYMQEIERRESEYVSDTVKHPPHYADKRIEVIDYIKDTLTPDGFTDYCIGNVIKYVSRFRKKGGKQDLQKAATYLKWAEESYEDEKL